MVEDTAKAKRMLRAYFKAEFICNETPLQGNLRRKRAQQKIKFKRWLHRWAKEE